MKDHPKYAWMNGNVIEWENCVLHARSQCAFWGANVFEGVRAYWQEKNHKLYIYQLKDHIKRLRESMKCLSMQVDHTDQEIIEACIELSKVNEFTCDIHIVITAYFSMGENYDLLGHTKDTGVHISALPIQRSPFYEHGLSLGTSTWRRISDDSMPPRIKAGANYHNSRLAHQEAKRNGYDTALFLNQRGTIAETPGACIVMYKNNSLITPPGISGVLEGITVDSIARLAKSNLKINFERREIDRTELYLAEEVFICGTLCEIQPVIAIDNQIIGNGRPGKMVRKLQAAYEEEVRIEPKAVYSLPISIPQKESKDKFSTKNNLCEASLVESIKQTPSKISQVIDLTTPLSEQTPVIKLPPERGQAWPFQKEVISQYDENGKEVYWNNLRMSEHTGTHFDAPVHWISGKNNFDVSRVPLNHLIAPAVVIDMSKTITSPDFLLEKHHVETWCKQHGDLPSGAWLLYRCGWDIYTDTKSFLNDGHTPGVSPECAKWLAEETGIIGFGVETVGTDAGQANTFTPPYPVHWYFHGANKYGLTQLKNLAKLPPVGAYLIIAPLPIVGGSGSPCRVYAFVDNQNQAEI